MVDICELPEEEFEALRRAYERGCGVAIFKLLPGVEMRGAFFEALDAGYAGPSLARSFFYAGYKEVLAARYPHGVPYDRQRIITAPGLPLWSLRGGFLRALDMAVDAQDQRTQEFGG